jgi:cystathionine beta-lyase/cystathionine gamma-synthase
MPKKRKTEDYNNSILPPTYSNASYFFDGWDDVIHGLHERTTKRGRYGRYNNPTWVAAEEKLTEIFRAEKSLIFASGMAAHMTAFLCLLKDGDHVVLPSESYRQIRNVFHKILPKFGVIVHEIPIRDTEIFLNELRHLPQLKLVHLEMPSSPHMYLTDIKSVRELVGPDTIITLDCSFSPPPNFYPLSFGVDLAICSGTKYLSGHGDILVGTVCGRADLIDQISWYRDTTGAIPDSRVAELLIRGLHTLKLRMQRVNSSASTVAEYLDAEPRIPTVLYTGLGCHPHRKLALEYLKGHGGVITFDTNRGKRETAKFVDALRIPYMASNFGAPQTLIEQSTLFTYFEYNDSQLESIGVSHGTVRLAIGYIDEPDDIIEDIKSSLAKTFS